MNSIEKLADSIYSKKTKKCDEYDGEESYTYFISCINKIAGIKIGTIELTFACYGCHFKINSNSICNGDYEDYILYAKNIPHPAPTKCQKKKIQKDYIIFYLTEFKNILKNLKFDKCSGRFVLDGDIDNIMEVLEDIDNVELIYDDCCVCRDKTTTTTICNHHICYECYSNLKVDDDNNRTCPICRDTDDRLI